MKKTKHTEDQIIGVVQQMEAGRSAKELALELGVTDQTLYNWKSKYGGMEVSEAKRLKSLEDENRRLKEIVADLSLDKEALKAVIRKTGGACERAPGRGVRDEGVPFQRTPGLQAPRSQPGELPV
jgi:putative transposase